MASVIKSLQLDSDHFNFDLTEGFEMAVEKDWNVLDVVDINDTLPIYDSDLRRHMPTKYGIRLFFKACVPMCYVDSETYQTNPLLKDADNASYQGKYFSLEDGTPIGSPVIKQSQGSAVEQGYGEFGYHGLLVADNIPSSKEAYALPEYRELNHTNITLHDFATGCTIATPNVGGLGNGNYYQPVSIDALTEDVQNFTFELMTPAGFNDGGVISFMVNNGALAYTVSTEGNRLNVPTDNDHNDNYKYLQPALFQPFGVGFKDHVGDSDTVGWFYCVLGVIEISEEDPDFQIDPSIVRLSSDNLQIDPVEGTYTYSGALASSSGSLVIHVPDDVTVTSILLNNSSVTVPELVDNKYTISYYDALSSNTLEIQTLDLNDQTLTYTFTLTYTEPSSQCPLVSISDGTGLGEMSTITGVDGVTDYTGKYLTAASNYKYQWKVEVADGYEITYAGFYLPSSTTYEQEMPPEALIVPDDWNQVNVGTPVDNVYSFQHAGPANMQVKWYVFTISDGTDSENYYIQMFYDGPQIMNNVTIVDSDSNRLYIATDSDSETTYTRVEASGYVNIDSVTIVLNGAWYVQGYNWTVVSAHLNGSALTVPSKEDDSYELENLTFSSGDNALVITVTNGTDNKTYRFNINRS